MAAMIAALACYVGVTLPPRTLAFGGTVPPNLVFGAYHVHSARSDGSGTPDEIAAAAARAGLRFVILTDHGDGTRVPDPPAYRHGVLCIDAVEINTLAGHVVALGLDRAAPYPLAGEARDVIEDIHRLGGWAVVAHPDSPNADLRWRDWNAAYDGVEWLNADSEWRDEAPERLVGVALRSIVRPAESIASLFARPSRTLQRWDAASQSRPIVTLAGADAHARFDWRRAGEPRPPTIIARPRYEDMFRTLVQAVAVDGLTGDAASDAARLLEALEHGRTYTVVRGFATPGVLEFAADQSGTTTILGGRLPGMGPMRMHAAIADARDVDLTLLRGGAVLARGKGSVEFVGPPSPGTYRVEAYLPGMGMPWIVSNPIYAGPVNVDVAPPLAPTAAVVTLPSDRGWRTEHDAASTAELTMSPLHVALGFALGPGTPAGQYGALVAEVEGPDAFDGVRFIARADRPMRVSVQVRLLGGQRWRRSVYVDTTARPIAVALQEFEPAEANSVLRPTAARIRSLLFVIDTLNAAPGTRGTLTLESIALSKAPADAGGMVPTSVR